jgi:hypothetical protein
MNQLNIEKKYHNLLKIWYFYFLFQPHLNKIGSKSNQIMNQLNRIKNKTICSKFDFLFFFLFQPELEEIKKK